MQRELTYDVQIKNTLQILPTKMISFDITSLAFRGSILWNAMPDTIKSAENVFRFKKGRPFRLTRAIALAHADTRADSCIYKCVLSHAQNDLLVGSSGKNRT